MKTNSDKGNISFYLPELQFPFKPYEELVYQQNKFILYSNETNNKSLSRLSSSKTSNYPSRPNTTATFNARFSPKNQLSRNRNQESIDKFIQTHQKINSVRYQPHKPHNQLKKIKSSMYPYKNHQSLSQNQFLTKGKLDNSQFTKTEILNFQQQKSNAFSQQQSFPYAWSSMMRPEQRLIDQIKLSKRQKQSLDKKESNRNKLTESIQSLDKFQTQRSLDEQKMNTMIPLQKEMQKTSIQIKARNNYPLRKSISMTPMQTKKFLKNSKLMMKDLQNQQETKKQPEIKQQNPQQVSEKKVIETEQTIKTDDQKNLNSIDYLFDLMYISRMNLQIYPRYQYSVEDTQVKPQGSKSFDDLQMQSIVEENMRKLEEKLIKEDISLLDSKLAKLMEKSQQQQTQNNSSQMEKSSSLQSKFFKQKSKASNKKVNMSQLQQFIEIDENSLKRALIIDYLNQNYYKSIKDLYWKMASQQKNAQLGKEQNQNCYQSQNFSYSNNISRSQINSESPSQLPVESNINQQVKQSIYVDQQFLHQTIQIPQHQCPVTWMYFAPCPKSSLFPKVLKLPQHYVQTSMKKPLLLIRLLNCLLTVNPKVVQRLFQPVYNNVFSVWLNIKGVFEPVFVDGYLPYDSKLNSLYGHSQEFLWIGVLIKAAAKAFGGYEAIQKLSFEQWCRIILGFSLQTLPKPEYQEIKQWGEQQFGERIQEYFKKGQIKYKSNIIIHKKQSLSLSIIKSIHNNKIRFTDCDDSIKKHEISLFELLLDKSYVLFLIPQAKQLYHRSGEFDGYCQGNIVSFQLRVYEEGSWLNVRMGLDELLEKELQSLTKNTSYLKRRLLIYEIPVNFKKNSKKEMTLKYAIDNFFQIKSKSKSQINTLFETYLSELKKGQYKIFIECGNIQLNHYLESHSQNINKWVKSEESYFFDDYIAKTQIENKNSKNSKGFNNYRNLIIFTSNNRIEITGGQCLIMNENTVPNELIEDENYRYFSLKTNDLNNRMSQSFYQ